MKQLYFALILVILSGCNFGLESELEGRWVGTNQGKEITIVFKDNKEFVILAAGEFVRGTYSTYGSSNPYDLDLYFGSNEKVATIISVDGDLLRLENNNPGKARPLSFSKNAIFFTKQ